MQNSTTKKVLKNLQGFIFRSEALAKEYYGARFETTILEKVVIDEDGQEIGEW